MTEGRDIYTRVDELAPPQTNSPEMGVKGMTGSERATLGSPTGHFCTNWSGGSRKGAPRSQMGPIV